MEIRVSDTIGFCFGVKEAVDLAKKALSNSKKRIFSVGPIIHNPQVVKELLEDGLTPVVDIEAIKEGTLIISSHGAGAKLLAKSESASGGKDKNNAKLEIIDATCPFVKKIQGYVKRLHKDKYKVVIIGKSEHPEVKALVDFTDGRAVVIKDKEEAKGLEPDGSKIGVVSQSTYLQEAFLEIVSILLQKPFLELRIFNTICRDTVKRQDAARRLANNVDLMIVIGGRDSANTYRLAEVCREEKKTVYHIEDSAEVVRSWLSGKDSVGIASGASTPDWVVRAVVEEIRRYC